MRCGGYSRNFSDCDGMMVVRLVDIFDRLYDIFSSTSSYDDDSF